MVKKKTHEDYIREVEEKHNGEIEVLEEYKGSDVKILHKHETCGYIWDVIPYSILKGKSCPKCAGNMIKTHEDYITQVEEKHNGEIEMLGEYINTKIKIRHKHVSCGHEWNVLPYSILRGSGCPKCRGNERKTHEDYIIEVEEKRNGEIEVLEEYKGTHTKIRHKHKCGHEWNVLPSMILHGKGCPKCVRKKQSNRQTKTHEDYITQVEEKHNGEIEVIGVYKNSYTKIRHKHKCGHEWNVIPDSILYGSGCPKCSLSKGEMRVTKWLEENKISFKGQYEFDGLVGLKNKPLRYDFAVFKDDKLHSIIEYDGQFHFFKMFENDGHEEIVAHDKIKNQYCLENKINLIRIPYFDFDNIEEILEYELQDLMKQLQPA